MRDINLFPRKPFAQRNLIFLFLCIAAVGVLFFLIQFHYSNQYIDSGVSAELDKNRVEEKIRQINDKRVPDERTLQFQNIRREVDQLKLRRTDWLSDITYILGFLPNEAVVKNMNVDSAALLKMELHFKTIPALLTYLTRLESEPSYAALNVTELTKVSPEPEQTSQAEESLSFPFPPSLYGSSSDEQQQDTNEASSQLESLLRGSEQSTGDVSEEISTWLQEDSPFTLDEILNGMSGTGTVVPETPTDATVETQTAAEQEEVNAQSVDLPDAGAKDSETEYYRLLIEIQLHSSKKGSK